MANGNGINVILAVREHIDDEIEDTRDEIASTEKKLAEQREHLYALMAIRHAAGVPTSSPKIETGASVVAEDARASSETSAISAPALHVA